MHYTTQLRMTHKILSDLIGFPTVSSQSNLDIIEYIDDYLSSLGASSQIFVDDSGNKANLFATLGGDGDGGIVLSGHTDVVPITDQDWLHDPFTMIERDDRLYGRGSCDMKGFIACALAMASEFAKANLERPVHFAFTYDEEVGCFGASHLIEQLQRQQIQPSIAIIGEPTQMRIIEGHKGSYTYTTKFAGLEGHGSRPELGVNAAEYAAKYVCHLIHLGETLMTKAPLDSRFTPPWTTINVGSIHGGVAHNIIASKCLVDWELRPVQSQDVDLVTSEMRHYSTTELLPKMRSVCGDASIQTRIISAVEGLVPMDDNSARDLIAQLTGSSATELISFCTEAGLFQSMAIDCVVCGPGSIEQAHKANEFVTLQQLQECLTMLGKLCNKLSK